MNWVLSALICLFAFMPTVHAQVSPYQFEPGEIDDIGKLVDAIVKARPPSEHEYFVVGRSPTPVEAYMRLLGITVHHLPFSASSYYTHESYEPEIIKSKVHRFWDYALRPFLPKRKKVLFIDFVSRGDSLGLLLRLSKEYVRLQNFDRPPVIKGLGLTSDNKTMKWHDMLDEPGTPPEIFQNLKISSSLLRKIADESRYKKYSYYYTMDVYIPPGEFPNPPRQLEPSRTYHGFEEAMGRGICKILFSGK